MMKNKKLKFTLALLFIFIASSCADSPINNDYLPHLDGVAFEQIDSFEYDNTQYTLSIPNSDETYYLYKESKYTTSCSKWIINYTINTSYLVDSDLNEDINLFNEVHSLLTKNIDKINSRLNTPISYIYKYNEEVLVEEQLINTFGGEVSFMYYDHFLPVRLHNVDALESYNISIPLNRTHLLMNQESIISPVDRSVISLDQFYSLPKSTKNIYY